MKKPQHNSFKLKPIAAAIAIAMASQFPANVALAGSGFGSGVTTKNAPVTIPTYYANSPSGNVPALDPATGLPVVNPATGLAIDPATGHPYVVNSGKALRKFVDTLPGIPGITSFGANNLGQYIPVAVPEKNWVNPATGVATTDDYYEIAAVEFSEKMHSDLPKATHLRGYVQLETAGNAATSKHIALTYPNGTPILDAKGVQVYAYDNPHHLGPIVNATKGTAVRVKFTNYLPVGGKLFVPVDTTITGAGLGPDGVNSYTQNRAEIHLVGGQSPWISAGTPHQWVAPAGEAAAYAAGLGKGASAQNVPDMADPGNGSTTLFFPNDMSARFMFYQDRTSGLTRLNSYVGLEAGYVVTDPVEQALVAGGTIGGVPVAAGTVPADQIPLIIEDKTFVPQNIAQQDAKWDTVNWGQPGDLWFPHVYEPNQDPNSISGANPVGRWDYGPLFWPIFPVIPAKATLPSPSFTPEAYMDTPIINGTAYPTLTVDPKAYRFRILNASNDRYINLGLYKADPSVVAPQLDANGNPMFDAGGAQLVMTNTEVKMIPAAADVAGNPPGWDTVNNVQLPLPQFPNLPWNINAEPSGPTRAWPVDARAGGAPDPTTSGPDFVVIGNDGGLLPHAVDIPSQPVTYEQNRRSITVTNIYGYGMLLGPAERADAIVDFSNYAGQTLILYNDAPAPTPFNDPRNDYYTGDPDLTSTGGAYSTRPGYGPNTRTMMQIKVNATNTSGTGGPLNAVALAAALPAAYGASQPAPTVPEVAYNAAFGTNDADTYAHVATGSAAQPTLNVTTNGALTLTGVQLVSSGGAGTGSGTGYLTAPLVNIVGGGGTGATAVATINPTTQQVSSVTLTNPGTGYTSAPTITFTPTAVSGKVAGIGVTNAGSGYTAPTVSISGGGGTGATATATVATSAATVAVVGGSGYTAPTVTVSGGGVTGVTGTATVGTSAATVAVVGGSGYTAPTVTVSGGGVTGVTGSATVGTSAATIAVVGGSGYTAPTVTVSGGGVTGVTGSATVDINGVITGITLTPNAGFTSAPTITISDATGVGASATATVDPTAGTITGVTLTPNAGFTSAPNITISDATGVGASATATVAATAGTITGVTLTPNAGFTSAPTIAISDATGVGASATATVLPGAGVITGVTLTPNAGFTSAPTVTISDATGTGASATATVAAPAGTITGVTLTPNAGFTSAPTITISDATGTGASATATVAANAGTITGVTVTNAGTGFTSAPTIVIADSTGTGATAAATISGTSGVGAQAQILTSNTQQLPVLTKAEQELFDDYGRYNSTGGVELPLLTATTQTTVPLNYIDSPTEIIGDNEVQIWKLVDNGFWSNSIHFDQVDVQLINRVGWDGTVKPPATDEVGWKDTLRLNPLEDAIVAIRAKRPNVPFGMPGSSRLMDPSKKAGTTGTAASGLGFTTAAGVTPALLASNTVVNYDNEFAWNSAILGHSEDDFTRPVVFHPTVVKPAAPTITGGSAGNLTWTDATPAGVATTLANPQNEIGFKILRATYRTSGTLILPYAQIGAVPANATSYTDATQVAGTDYSYEVVAWNNAGSATSVPYTEVTAPAVPTWPATGAVVVNSNGTVTLKWNTVVGATQYIVTANGTALAPIAAVGGTTQTATVTLAVGSVYSITVTAQQVKFGQTATSAASTPVTADMTLPNTPAAPTVSGVTANGMTVNWSAVTRASGAAITGYTLQYSTNGGTTWANVGTGTGGVRTTAASLGAASTSAAVIGMAANTSYTFQLRANGPAGNGAYSPASTAQLTLPGTPTGVSAANGAIGAPITGGLNWSTVAGLTYTVSWTGPATGSATATSGQQLPFATAGVYSMTVTATNAAGNSAASTAVNVTVR